MTTSVTLFSAITAMALFSLSSGAAAHSPLRAYDLDAPGPEASGCYFSRGEMFCGRYCYVEINGKRYCQPRERDAYPQGEIYIEESLVGPPYRRGRSYHRRHHHGLK